MLVNDNYLRFSFRMLKALENLAKDVPIGGNKTLVVVSKNMAVAVKVVDTVPTNGILIKASGTRQSGYNHLSITSTRGDKADSRNSEATIHLSSAMLRKVRLLKPNAVTRIFSFTFDNDKLFSERTVLFQNETAAKPVKKKVNSRILSAAVANLTLQNLTYEEELKGLFNPLSTKDGRVDCVFWDFQAAGIYIYVCILFIRFFS